MFLTGHFYSLQIAFIFPELPIFDPKNDKNAILVIIGQKSICRKGKK